MDVLAVFVCFNYFHAVMSLAYTRHLYRIRENWVMAQKEQGNRNPVVPQILSEFDMKYNAIYGLSDLVTYPVGLNNLGYEELYGLDTIISTPYEKWNAIYKNGDPSWMNRLELQDYIHAITADTDHVILITCDGTRNLDEEQKNAFRSLGLNLSEDSYECAMLKEGKIFQYSSDPSQASLDDSVNGHYVWLSSTEDPDYCDILVDHQEYTNDNPGISIAVLDPQTGIVADSITFNKDHGTQGIRYYSYRSKD